MTKICTKSCPKCCKCKEYEIKYEIERPNILVSDVQTGKRNMCLEYIGQCLESDNYVIFFTSNYTSYVNQMKTTLKNNDIPVCDTNYKNNIVDELKDSNRVVCLNGNEGQMKHAIQVIKKLPQKKFNIIFDEVDDIVGENSSRGELIKKLVNLVNGRIICFTATPFILFWKKDILGCDIYGSDVLFVEPPETHVNFDSFKVHCTDHEFKQTGFMCKEDRAYIDDCFGKCSTHTFYKNEEEMKVKGVLINPGKSTGLHEQIKNYLLIMYPNAFVVMVNGSNDVIFNIKRDISGKTYEPQLTKTLSVIQDFWQKDDLELFVIGSNKVGRSVSLRAERKQMPKSCNEMLMILNHIYQPAKNIDHSNNYQNALRLQGLYFGLIPELNLFTNNRVHQCILSYRINIENMKESYQVAYNKLTMESCPDVSEEFYKFENKTIKPYTSQKAKHKYYSVNNKIFPTFESKLLEMKNMPCEKREFKSPICVKIIDILTKVYPNELSVEEIYNSIDVSDWTITSKTPVASISKECLYMYENSKLNRSGNPYKYSLIL